MNDKSVIALKVYDKVTKEFFTNEIYPQRVPAILKGVDIGACVQLWTADYLAKKVGDEPVKIHVTTNPQMDFICKNFAYRSLPFNEVIRRTAQLKQTDYFFTENELYYLRSLGEDSRKDVADVQKQFPELANDIKIPNFFPEEKFFSSVFRIASPGVQLWTHYDIMDNLLIQVRGRKKISLFSPEDIDYLYLQGDKSVILNIDEPNYDQYPLFRNAQCYEGFIDSGDILFIPALWFHNVKTIDFGVAVNVFWQHLDSSLYNKKDIYGNKDLVPAAYSFQLLDKALKSIKNLPDPYRNFYARRMINNIEKFIEKDNL